MRFGLGPVFEFEWLFGSRRWQVYATRALFVAALLIALVVVWQAYVVGKSLETLRAQAEVGVSFFYAIIGTQITLILLAAPAATAASICLDKTRGTLAHVLVTDLCDWEIVLGKLAARLLPALALVACTLPMMSLCTLLGGIDPDALFGAFLITLGVAVLGATLALAFSVWARKTHEVLMGTYAVWGLWLMVGPITSQVFGYLPGALKWLDRLLGMPVSARLDDSIAWVGFLQEADPYRLAFRPYINPTKATLHDGFAFLFGTLAVSAVLAAVSVWKLRTAYVKSLSQSAGKRPRLGWFERINRFGNVFDRLPGPSLDGNPVLWREWHRNRPSRLSRIVGTVYLVLAAAFSLIALAGGGGGPYSAWVNGMQAAIGIMLLSVSASTSLAEERARGSLDILLATPLSTFKILSGKWWGTFRLVPLLTVLPALVALGEWVQKSEHFLYVVSIPMMILAYGAGATSLGLAVATWVRGLGRAMGLTLGIVVFMTVGWLFLCIALFQHQAAERIAMGSPFMGPGELTFEINNGPARSSLDAALGWTSCYLVGACALFLFTWRSFSRCLGCASDHPGQRRTRSRDRWLRYAPPGVRATRPA
jgi:ABC-type transport system involved in multi-copper enzyme maturation permease subunit